MKAAGPASKKNLPNHKHSCTHGGPPPAGAVYRAALGDKLMNNFVKLTGSRAILDGGALADLISATPDVAHPHCQAIQQAGAIDALAEGELIGCQSHYNLSRIIGAAVHFFH